MKLKVKNRSVRGKREGHIKRRLGALKKTREVVCLGPSGERKLLLGFIGHRKLWSFREDGEEKLEEREVPNDVW